MTGANLPARWKSSSLCSTPRCACRLKGKSSRPTGFWASRIFSKSSRPRPRSSFDDCSSSSRITASIRCWIPPEVVDFFNNVRKGYEAEVGDLEARRKAMERARQRDKEECDKVRAGPTIVERRVGRNSFAVNFIPFGAGQFQNGHRKKGWAFLVTETVLGAASVAAFATNLAVYGFRPQRSCRYDVGSTACPADAIDHTDENRSRRLTQVQVASGAMFFGAVAWGILDAIYFYKPETQLSLTEATKHPTSIGTLRLSPTVMERAIGPGLSFRF